MWDSNYLLTQVSVSAFILALELEIPGVYVRKGSPGGSDGKETTCNAGDLGSVPGSGRSPGGEHDNPLQYSCLENPMERGPCQATVHRVAKSWTRLKQLSTHTPMTAGRGSLKRILKWSTWSPKK